MNNIQTKLLVPLAMMLTVLGLSQFLGLELAQQSSTVGHITPIQGLFAGIKHVWTGFDHMLFLICMILPLGRKHASLLEKPYQGLLYILTCITGFTVANSITLLMGLGGVSPLAHQFVELLIALALIIASASVLQEFCPSMLLLSIVYGVAHGYGYGAGGEAHALGLASLDTAATIITFNIGLELGKVIFVLTGIPLLHMIRVKVSRNEKVIDVSASLILLIGTYWAALNVV